MDRDLEVVLERIEKKIDALAEAVDALKGKGHKGAAEGNVKPSDKKIDDQVSEIPDTEGGRLKCPKCGSLKVSQHKDMKKVLSYSGGIPIYGQKFQCNQCSNEW